MTPSLDARSIFPWALSGSPFISTVPDVLPLRSRIRSGKTIGSAASRLLVLTPFSLACTSTLFGLPNGTISVKSAEPPAGSDSFPFASLKSSLLTPTSAVSWPSGRPRIETSSIDALPSTSGEYRLPFNFPLKLRRPATSTSRSFNSRSTSGARPVTSNSRLISAASVELTCNPRSDSSARRSKRPDAVISLLSVNKRAFEMSKSPRTAESATSPLTGTIPRSAVPALAVIAASIVPDAVLRSVPSNVNMTVPLVLPSIGITRPLCRAASFERSSDVNDASTCDRVRELRAIVTLPIISPSITRALSWSSSARSLLISTFAVAEPRATVPIIPPPMLMSAVAR